MCKIIIKYLYKHDRIKYNYAKSLNTENKLYLAINKT